MMSSTNPEESKWLVVRKPRADAKMRLFCFPFAGGGASVFRQWSEKLPDLIEVVAVQYPGRENRIVEPPIDNLDVIVSTVCELVFKKADKPFAFFGHSLGAKTAFEVAKKLEKERSCRPEYLFVSGSRAPDIPAKLQLHKMDDERFIDSLRLYAGTPDEVLENRELTDLFLPMLRADFVLDETFDSASGEKTDSPIYVFAGSDDNIAPLAEVEKWKDFTNAGYGKKIFNGGHFFFKDAIDEILDCICRVLKVETKAKQPSSWQRGAYI